MKCPQKYFRFRRLNGVGLEVQPYIKPNYLLYYGSTMTFADLC